MTCEDADAREDGSAVERAADRMATLLGARPVRDLARRLPPGVRRALASLLRAAANALRA
jgi:hypothetical protein